MPYTPQAQDVLVIVAAYALGCFAAGYYLVRWWTGADVRTYGSGGVGATNTGRVLGRTAFLLTLAVDFFKGTLAVWLANYFQLKPVGIVLAMLAVVAGHVWPIQLRFHGGKGVATCLGAMVLYDPTIALVLAGAFAAAFALVRQFVLAGMLGFAVVPFVLFGLDHPLDSVFGLSALAVIILIAHRRNIRDELTKAVSLRRLKRSKETAHQ